MPEFIIRNPLSTAGSFQDAPTIPMGLPVCTEVAREIVSLPMYPEMTHEQVKRVGHAVCQIVQSQEMSSELV